MKAPSVGDWSFEEIRVCDPERASRLESARSSDALVVALAEAVWVDDTYLALTHPHEAFVFIYRGFEWLRTALKLSWEDIASDVGVSVSEIKELGKMANYETGVRHASMSGEKLRADPLNYGTWVCGLIDGVNAARKRLEPDFERMDATTVAEAVKKAAPITAYE